jgi:hypothetical protein
VSVIERGTALKIPEPDLLYPLDATRTLLHEVLKVRTIAKYQLKIMWDSRSAD